MQDNEKRCKNGGKCIPAEYFCDNDLDCTDGSDEENCPPTLEQSCQLPNWTCDNDTTCLDIKQLCDGVVDCKDKSDEGLRCHENLCHTQDNDCSDLCRNTPGKQFCLHLFINFCFPLYLC